MKMTKYIPNFLTLLNLLSGLTALIFVFKENWLLVALFVSMGIFFDFFDGLAARSFKVSSALGLQLDSLADMVTSGVVPGFVMSFLIAKSLHISFIDDFNFDPKHLVALFGLIITLASAYRLAKFNIDTRQTGSFIGLPTPANTLFIISLPLILYNQNYAVLKHLLSNSSVLILISLISAYLLNAEIPLFSLKFKNFTWQHNWPKYILIILSLILLPLLGYLSIPVIIILYLLISLYSNFKNA